MSLPSLSRRHFLKTSALAASALGFPAFVRSQSPNSEIRVGMVGFNSRGQSHLADLVKINGVKVTALCDVDEAVLGKSK
ncbi:MAG: twin-arginine translocation signal domain-containing protein, partial [Chthoniobacteraceae bacterium]